MYSDPIADMITRIRNGYMSQKEKVIIPFSNVKKAIADVLVSEKYLKEVTVLDKDNKKDIEVTLQYKDSKPAIKKIIRVSKVGKRIYQPKTNLPYVLSGTGHAIISTSKGVMTAVKARKQSLGGEVICKIW